MKRWQCKGWLALAVLCGWAQLSVVAQPALPPVSGAVSAVSTNSESGTNYLKSPVDTFRELLAMSQAERDKFLSTRPQKIREGLEGKLQEYEALNPDERELRLRATELHWYLLPLMKMSETTRKERLSKIQPEMRKLLETRLQLWSILPPPISDELLENEPVLSLLFAQPETNTAAILAGMSAEQRLKLQAGIDRWQAMPDWQRQQIRSQFSSFFELNADEKERVLNTLSETERKQMEKTLAEFEKLPRQEREVCIASFQKFARMSLAERELFLRNAERWKQMKPAERQVWRDLVSQVPNWPPMPPMPPPPMPPMPGAN